MVAVLKPLLTTRTEYIGFRLVSDNDFEGWIEFNVDALANNFFLEGGLGLDKLAAFSAREWENQRDRCNDYANTLRQY